MPPRLPDRPRLGTDRRAYFYVGIHYSGTAGYATRSAGVDRSPEGSHMMSDGANHPSQRWATRVLDSGDMAISEVDATNRSRLIQAAADVFATHGFEGASLRLIAEAADVSFQLITYYFGTKEKLWFEAFEYLHRRYLETGRGLAFLASGDINEQFRSHILLLLTDLVQRPQVRKIYIQEYLSGSDRFSSTIKKTIHNIANNHTLPYYREVVRLGIVKEYTAQEIGVLFSAIVNNNLVFPDYLEQLLGVPTGSREVARAPSRPAVSNSDGSQLHRSVRCPRASFSRDSLGLERALRR